MLLELPPDDGRPIYVRIADAVATSISDGDVAVGERLPAARELGDALGVNGHTVLKAYDELRRRGQVAMRRGRGAVVVDEGPRAAARRFVGEARRAGLERREVERLIESVIEEEWT